MIRRFAARMLLPLLAFASASAHAILPDSGWYWNPSEGGRGVSIEVQDDKIFLAIYTYETSGVPVYYYAAGPMQDDHTFNSNLYRTGGGQCLGCGPRAATSTPVGFVNLSFTTPETATLTALGTTLSLQRFDFSDTNLFNPQLLYGEWATTEGEASLGTFFGERMTFTAPLTTSGGLYATGTRTGAPARTAVAQCTTRATCTIGLSYSTSNDEFYTFSMAGFNRAEGLVQIVPAGGSPSAGAGFAFVMQRIRTGAKVRTGVGPGMTKELLVDSRAEAEGALKAEYARKARPAQEMVDAYSTPEAARLLESVAAELARMKAAAR